MGEMCGPKGAHARGAVQPKDVGKPQGKCAEHTRNMFSISVTLDVSKLSGRLNANASCVGSKEGACDSGRDAGRTAGGREVLAAAQAARTRRVQMKAV